MCDYGFIENEDYILVTQKKVTNNPKNPESAFNEYFISLDMAKEICMIQRSEIGKKFRQYFIECEKELRQKIEEENRFLKTRKESKKIRNQFTDVLKNHGYTKQYEYIQTTKQMKKTLGIEHKKDGMTEDELDLVMCAEKLSRLSLKNEQGYHEVNPVCVDVSKSVTEMIENHGKLKIA